MTTGTPSTLPVEWRLSAHARRLVTLALAGLLIAIITRRAEFAGLAAPALLLLLPRPPGRTASIGVDVVFGGQRAPGGLLVEGDTAALLVRITGAGGDSARLRLHPAPWISAEPAIPRADGWFQLPFRAERWGYRPVGVLEVILHDRWRLAQARLTVRVPVVSCYPLAAQLERRIVLSKLPARLGDHAARATGEGTEFVGVREYVPGDRQRRINWPATTRRGTLQLNTFAAERAQSVVILLDRSVDVGAPGSSSTDLAVRAATGIATAYLAVRDRVGLISFGQRVRWISPAAGRRQADRIMNMIMTDPRDGDLADMVSKLPGAAVPAGALIIVVSPLLTLRLIEALRELRERGFATIVVDVLCAEPELGSGSWGPGHRYGGRGIADLARRVWRMEQQAIRFSLRELGIPVVHWDGQSSLDEPLAPYARRPIVNRG